MLCWQQNQREDSHMCLLGQAILDEKQYNSSSDCHFRVQQQALLKAALGGHLEGETEAACLVGRTFCSEHVPLLLSQMSWLPLGFQVRLKLLLTFEAFHSRLGSHQRTCLLLSLLLPPCNS